MLIVFVFSTRTTCADCLKTESDVNITLVLYLAIPVNIGVKITVILPIYNLENNVKV